MSAYELVIDNFAGGGGASCGIELAIGRPVDAAINHDPRRCAGLKKQKKQRLKFELRGAEKRARQRP